MFILAFVLLLPAVAWAGTAEDEAAIARLCDDDGKSRPAESQLFLRVFVKKDGGWLLRGFFPARERAEE